MNLEETCEKQSNGNKNELKRSRIPYIKEKPQKKYETKADKKFKDKTQNLIETKTKEGMQLLTTSSLSQPFTNYVYDNSAQIQFNPVTPLCYKDNLLSNSLTNFPTRQSM